LNLKDIIGDHSSGIARALCKNLLHQHSKVRKSTIEALGEILLTKNASSTLNEVIVNLKSIINDKVSEVRKATYIIIAKLINGFPKSVLIDWEAELLQLLLNGLTDEQLDVISLCMELLECVGKNIKYLESND